MTRVLITGASGILGRALTAAYVARGAEVHTAQRRPVADAHAGSRHHALDVRDQAAVTALIAHAAPDLVIHLAGELTSDAEAAARASMRGINVGGTGNVLAAVARQPSPAAVITASSERAYGPSGGRILTEADALTGLDAYGATKAEADRMTRDAAAGGLRAAVLRLSNTYGPGDPNATRIVPCVTRSLVTGRPLRLRSPGMAQRDFLYIDDAAAAYLAVADRLLDQPEGVSGMAFNVGTGVGTTVLELAGCAAASAGAPLPVEPAAEPAGQIAVEHRVLDASLITKTTGWAPLVGLQDGLAETVAAARASLVTV